jgi:hypothetical protein
MKTIRKLLVVILALIASGLAMQPFERSFTSDLRERRLLPQPIDLDTRQALGQATFAIALGGLRPLIASLRNLKAHTYFEYQEWGKLEGVFKTITTLQPHTRYYWDVASWHLAYNAYADYADKPDIPDARRRYLQKEYLDRGLKFLVDGIDNNPDDWRLRQAYIRILTDPFKPNDFPKAVEAIDEAMARGPVPSILHREKLYSLARIPGREEEAWETAQEVWEDPANRDIPSIRLIYFALQHRFTPPESRTPLEVLFGPRGGGGTENPTQSRQNALKYLSYYWLRQREGFPMDGVAETIRILLKEFNIPEEKSPLNSTDWSGYPPDLFQPGRPPTTPSAPASEATPAP